jgi:hypothetical protein
LLFARRRVPRESWAETEVQAAAAAAAGFTSGRVRPAVFAGKCFGVGVPISGLLDECATSLIACSRNVWIWILELSCTVFDVKLDVHVLKLELTFQYDWMEFC